jgi:hypothetical protein
MLDPRRPSVDQRPRALHLPQTRAAAGRTAHSRARCRRTATQGIDAILPARIGPTCRVCHAD